MWKRVAILLFVLLPPLACMQPDEPRKKPAKMARQEKPVKKIVLKSQQEVDDEPPPIKEPPRPSAAPPAPVVTAPVVEEAAPVGQAQRIAAAGQGAMVGQQPRAEAVDPPVTLAEQTQWAVDFLLRVKLTPEERYDIRMISFAAVPAWQRAERLRTMNFWINNLSFERGLVKLQEVPNSGGRLYWFFLSELGWNAQAWATVAAREPYFVEPFIPHELAEYARELIAVKANPKTFNLDLIVRADWLFRDSAESARSDTYFDLLFAKQRFPRGEVTWETKTITVQHPGGAYVYPDDTKRVIPNVEPGKYTVELRFKNKDVAKAVNFPKNEQDWLNAVGAAQALDFLKKAQLNGKFAAVVDEGNSIVANNDRLIETIRTSFGRMHKTFDVTRTAGQRDFANQLDKDFVFDASELIASLPNGGQAYLLTDAKGNIVATADPAVAKDSSSKGDIRVRTPGSCVVCHAAGWIDPPNLIKSFGEMGIDILVKNNKKRANEIRDVFTGWEEEIKGFQVGYLSFLSRTSGFAPAQNSALFLGFRDWYDRPVTAQQAAMECGLPLEQFLLIASGAALQGTTLSPSVRALMLVQGATIPRSVWEEDEYPRVMRLIVLAQAGHKK